MGLRKVWIWKICQNNQNIWYLFLSWLTWTMSKDSFKRSVHGISTSGMSLSVGKLFKKNDRLRTGKSELWRSRWRSPPPHNSSTICELKIKILLIKNNQKFKIMSFQIYIHLKGISTKSDQRQHIRMTQCAHDVELAHEWIEFFESNVWCLFGCSQLFQSHLRKTVFPFLLPFLLLFIVLLLLLLLLLFLQVHIFRFCFLHFRFWLFRIRRLGFC